jgi:hypothetical protein
MEQEYTIDNSYLSPEAQKRKKDLEENPASRTNPRFKALSLIALIRASVVSLFPFLTTGLQQNTLHISIVSKQT